MDNKQNIANKIKALLAKTTANGATEAEALAAMAMARRLMEGHQINMSEVEVRAEGVEAAILKFKGRYHKNILDGIGGYVGKYTETKLWSDRDEEGLKFIGLTSDVAFAEWLLTMLVEYVERAAMAFTIQEVLQGTSHSKQTLMASFIRGAVSRLNDRMEKEIQERKRNDATQQIAATGRGLVLATKTQMIEAEFAKLGFKLRTSTSRRGNVGSRGAYDAGQSAGNNASFSKPINGGAGTRALR